jgi:FkbM family methyltransferase
MRFKFGRLLSAIKSRQIKFHTGQYGEDLFLHKKFRRMLNNGFYIDVGAHHPFAISNTAYLWTLGWNGVNVDASRAAIEEFKRVRPNDLNICAAVVSADQASLGKIKFYFNKEIDNCATCDALIAEERGLTNSVEVPRVTISNLIDRAKSHFGGNFDFLNIDIEGFDEIAIADIDAWPDKPKILMIEIYSKDLAELVQRPSVKRLMNLGYLLVERMGHTAVFTLGEDLAR